MDIKKFYDEINGDYNEALSRLMTDGLIEKMVKKFPTLNMLEPLEKAVNEKNLDDAFFAVHSLKGVALNLSFTMLAKSCSDLTEALRGENKNSVSHDVVEVLFTKIKNDYLTITSLITE